VIHNDTRLTKRQTRTHLKVYSPVAQQTFIRVEKARFLSTQFRVSREDSEVVSKRRPRRRNCYYVTTLPTFCLPTLWIPHYHLHVPIVLKSGSFNLLEPSGPVKACNGIDLPSPLPYRFQPWTLKSRGDVLYPFRRIKHKTNNKNLWHLLAPSIC
jgi:hypothetical protein